MTTFNKIFTRTRKLLLERPKGWRSLLFNTAMAKLKKPAPLMMPVHISIEPTNACNAKCPVCETGKGEMMRTKGLLDKTHYETLIDSVHETTASMMFYFMGEPFLHRDAYDMIKFARDRQIYVESCTNGDYIDPEGLLFSDINLISFQIGGLRQDSHEIYRVGSNLDRVIANLEALIDLRRKQPSSNVLIEVGFIVMKHNEHEVDEFKKWADMQGVDRFNIIKPCVRNMQEADKFLTASKEYWLYDEAAYDRGVLKPKHVPQNECTWLWNSIQLNWNGDAVPCCRDVNGLYKLGNVFDEGLEQVWNGKRAVEFRRKIVRNQDRVSLCKLCSGFGVPKL